MIPEHVPDVPSQSFRGVPETLVACECLDNLNVDLSCPGTFSAGNNASRCFAQLEFSQRSRMSARRTDVRTFPVILFTRLLFRESHNYFSTGPMTE